MKSWKAVLAVLCVFVLGTVFGLLISFWILPDLSTTAFPGREILTERMNQRLIRNLSLSPDQERVIKEIILDAKNQILQVREQERPRVRQILLNARLRIRARLTPEQQVLFDKKLERNRKFINRLISRPQTESR